MENFKAAVTSVCIVSAAICLIENLTSGTALKNQMKLMMKLIFALALLTPIVSGGAGIELPEPEDYEFSDDGYSLELYNSELEKAISENVADVLRGQLRAAGISFGNISVSVNISDDGSISISKVVISAEDFRAASEIIKNSLGEGTEVINEDT